MNFWIDIFQQKLLLILLAAVIVVAACSNSDEACEFDAIPAFVASGDTLVSPGSPIEMRLTLKAGKALPVHFFEIKAPSGVIDTIDSDQRFYTVGPEGVYAVRVVYKNCPEVTQTYKLTSSNKSSTPAITLFSVLADSVELGKSITVAAIADFSKTDSTVFMWQRGARVLIEGKAKVTIKPRKPGNDTISLFYHEHIYRFGYRVIAKVPKPEEVEKIVLAGLSDIQRLLSEGKRKEASDRNLQLIQKVGGGQFDIYYPQGCPGDTCRSLEEFYYLMKMGSFKVNKVTVSLAKGSQKIQIVKIQ